MKRKKTPTVDISLSAEALGLPFSEENWEATPTAVHRSIIENKKTIIEYEKTIAELSKRVEELERRVKKLLKRNSSDSDQPPSSDGPYRKPGASKERGKKPQGKKGHPGAKQQLLEPIELPAIPLEVAHFIRAAGRKRVPFLRDTRRDMVPGFLHL